LSFWHGFYHFLAIFFDLLSRYLTWMMTSISLVMAVQSNFCNWYFVYDHKFSMRLRSGEFQQRYLETPFLDIPGFQDNLTHSSSLFQMKTRDNILFKFSSIRKSPLPLISGMDFLSITSVQCICINSSYPQLAEVNLLQKS